MKINLDSINLKLWEITLIFNSENSLPSVRARENLAFYGEVRASNQYCSKFSLFFFYPQFIHPFLSRRTLPGNMPEMSRNPTKTFINRCGLSVCMGWRITKTIARMPQLNNPLLIEGLPGIGNVGKIAVDFMIEELDAKELCGFASFSMPHIAFIDENNLIEMPSINMYYKKFGSRKKRDLLFLVGDIQPLEEESAYEFIYCLLDLMNELKAKELITIGGIGLQSIPENPKVYCTGTSKKYLNKFSAGIKINRKLFGVVGPIIGVTGLLAGLAKEKDIDSVCLLAETFAHPLYLGVKGSQEVLKILQKKLDIRLNLKALEKEVREVETEILKKTEQLAALQKKDKTSKISYIG